MLFFWFFFYYVFVFLLIVGIFVFLVWFRFLFNEHDVFEWFAFPNGLWDLLYFSLVFCWFLTDQPGVWLLSDCLYTLFYNFVDFTFWLILIYLVCFVFVFRLVVPFESIQGMWPTRSRWPIKSLSQRQRRRPGEKAFVVWKAFEDTKNLTFLERYVGLNRSFWKNQTFFVYVRKFFCLIATSHNPSVVD